jgi:hypothetical protein
VLIQAAVFLHFDVFVGETISALIFLADCRLCHGRRAVFSVTDTIELFGRAPAALGGERANEEKRFI